MARTYFVVKKYSRMLPGIGTADELKAQGIDLVHDLPGVGKNMQDHLDSYIIAYCRQPVSYNGQDRFPAVIKHGIQYFLYKNGPATSVVAESGCFASADPAKDPLIDPNFHDVEEDKKMSVAGVRLGREILAQAGSAPYLDSERLPGPNAKTDDEILAYTRRCGSVDYHPVGTCKMGTDDMAVVGSKLRVRGLEGLRAVDASIMPTLISGNTNAPSIMIGEKGAAIIREEEPLR